MFAQKVYGKIHFSRLCYVCIESTLILYYIVFFFFFVHIVIIINFLLLTYFLCDLFLWVHFVAFPLYWPFIPF